MVTICSLANPCPSGFFCNFMYGGGEGLCFPCGAVPYDDMSGAQCCSAMSSNFNWGNDEPWAIDGFLSKENVQRCYAACSGIEPGLPGSSCAAATGSGTHYYIRLRLTDYTSVPQGSHVMVHRRAAAHAKSIHDLITHMNPLN
jgi:hypothetical protein